MLGYVTYLAILLLSACLPRASEIKSGGDGYHFDVSRLGHASVRYIDSEGKVQILPHSISRLSLASKQVYVTVLADMTQLLQAGSDEQQELQGIKPPAFAAKDFYVIGLATFYLQSNEGKKYFCQLENIPLGSKRAFSLQNNCEENAQEPDLVYFKHHFNDTRKKLSEKILQIDCEINYGDKKQMIHLAVQDGKIIDDQGRYAFAKQGEMSFKIKCRNTFMHKPVLGEEKINYGVSKEITANLNQLVCFKFSDGWLHTTWGNVSGKTAEACNQIEEPLSFYFSDKDPTRNDDLPLYLRVAKPFALMDNVVDDNTSQKDIRVLTQCDNCMPAWAEQLHCTAVCKSETPTHDNKTITATTVIDAGTRKHYGQSFFCKHKMQHLSKLASSAALTCTVFKPGGTPAENLLTLTSEIIHAGKVCVDFTPTKEITLSSSANCHSKLRIFFKAAEQFQ